MNCIEGSEPQWLQSGCRGFRFLANDQGRTTNDMFVDSHAHLDGERFASDREEVIARSREAGVATIVAIGNGEGPAQVDCGILLAERYEFICAPRGIHPHEAKLADDSTY